MQISLVFTKRVYACHRLPKELARVAAGKKKKKNKRVIFPIFGIPPPDNCLLGRLKSINITGGWKPDAVAPTLTDSRPPVLPPFCSSNTQSCASIPANS